MSMSSQHRRPSLFEKSDDEDDNDGNDDMNLPHQPPSLFEENDALFGGGALVEDSSITDSSVVPIRISLFGEDANNDDEKDREDCGAVSSASLPPRLLFAKADMVVSKG
jgi:hypothetical protein